MLFNINKNQSVSTNNNLQKYYSELKNSYAELLSNNSRLQSSHDELTHSYTELKRSHDEIKSSYNELKRSHDELILNNAVLNLDTLTSSVKTQTLTPIEEESCEFS